MAEPISNNVNTAVYQQLQQSVAEQQQTQATEATTETTETTTEAPSTDDTVTISPEARQLATSGDQNGPGPK